MTRTKFITSTILFLLLGSTVQMSAQSAVQVRPDIQSIANKLSSSDGLHLGLPVGFSGKPDKNNKYYKLYQKLWKKATIEELVALTSSNSKYLVLYSFVALRNKGYTDLRSIFLNHLNDTAFIWQAGGCTGVIDRVNTYMLAVLSPGSLNLPHVAMTKEEYDFYEKLIADKTNHPL